MNDPIHQPLAKAKIDWTTNQPFSENYQDVYFSRENGLAETDYVFIEGNNLKDRFKARKKDFTIAETGFGTGLNFLMAMQQWQVSGACNSASLHFVSAELCPLDREELQKALGLWRELKPFADPFIDNYSLPLPGIHRLAFPQFRTRLTLLYGDAAEMFGALLEQQSNATVDAWFLDGFAPAKNPGMWTPELFQVIAGLSSPGATFSTFTAASVVRKGLTEVGFDVVKAPGFGRKRDMLKGSFSGEKPNYSSPQSTSAWLSPAKPFTKTSCPKTPFPKTNRAVVIGAGIAGCATAAALASRGIRVTVIDRHALPAQEASGNPQGIIYPKLSTHAGTLGRFALAALGFALQYYRPFWHADLHGYYGEQCGLVMLPESPKQLLENQQIARLYPPELAELVSGRQLEAITGLRVDAEEALYFSKLGWVKPATVCQKLLDHPAIEYCQGAVGKLLHDKGQWIVLDSQGDRLAGADTVIVACGKNSTLFTQTDHLSLNGVPGQISIVPENSISSSLKTVICGHGYLAPANEGVHTLGASYRLGSTDLSVTEQDHRENLELLTQSDKQLAKLFGSLDVSAMSGRSALRCITPDYLPIAGPAPKAGEFLKDYAELRHNARAVINTPGSYYPNLYLNCGHGSRGMSYGPFCAEIIASHICGEFAPLDPGLIEAIHPARFLIRNLKRNRV